MAVEMADFWNRTGPGRQETGAGDGNRTHDIQLGKLTFYL